MTPPVILGSRTQYEDVASAYERRIVPRFEPIARQLLDAADPRPGEHVLEVAGGTGGFARLALPRLAPGGRYVLTDVSPSMLRVAGEVLPADPPGVELDRMRADLADLPFGPASFDLVVAQMSPLQESVEALAGVARVLRSEGRIALAFWGEAYDELALIERTRVRIGLAPRPAARPDDAAARVRAAGFGDVRVRVVTLVLEHPSVAAYLDYRASFGRPDGTDDDTWSRYWRVLEEEVRAAALPDGRVALGWSIALLTARGPVTPR